MALCIFKIIFYPCLLIFEFSFWHYKLEQFYSYSFRPDFIRYFDVALIQKPLYKIDRDQLYMPYNVFLIFQLLTVTNGVYRDIMLVNGYSYDREIDLLITVYQFVNLFWSVWCNLSLSYSVLLKDRFIIQRGGLVSEMYMFDDVAFISYICKENNENLIQFKDGYGIQPQSIGAHFSMIAIEKDLLEIPSLADKFIHYFEDDSPLNKKT